MTHEPVNLGRLGPLIFLERSQFFTIVLSMDIIANLDEFLILVRGSQQDDCDTNEIIVGYTSRGRRSCLSTRESVSER